MMRRINSHFGFNVTLLMARTGMRANISGQTLHHALRIPAFKTNLAQLNTEAKIILKKN